MVRSIYPDTAELAIPGSKGDSHSSVSSVRLEVEQHQLVVEGWCDSSVGIGLQDACLLGLFENGHQQFLRQTVERGIGVKPALDDGEEHINGHGAPDLRFHRVLGRIQKTPDPQTLLDPFEHLPTASVEGGDDRRRQGRIVGQERQCLARFRVFETDSPQMLGIVLET